MSIGRKTRIEWLEKEKSNFPKEVGIGSSCWNECRYKRKKWDRNLKEQKSFILVLPNLVQTNSIWITWEAIRNAYSPALAIYFLKFFKWFLLLLRFEKHCSTWAPQNVIMNIYPLYQTDSLWCVDLTSQGFLRELLIICQSWFSFNISILN